MIQLLFKKSLCEYAELRRPEEHQSSFQKFHIHLLQIYQVVVALEILIFQQPSEDKYPSYPVCEWGGCGAKEESFRF
jgi:hypothetical protein